MTQKYVKYNPANISIWENTGPMWEEMGGDGSQHIPGESHIPPHETSFWYMGYKWDPHEEMWSNRPQR